MREGERARERERLAEGYRSKTRARLRGWGSQGAARERDRVGSQHARSMHARGLVARVYLGRARRRGVMMFFICSCRNKK